MRTDLKRFNNDWYKPGASLFKQTVWLFVNGIFFKSSLFPSYRLKCFLLKLFGAKVGEGVVIKPNVNIKYPWRLVIGNHSWIGEEVWIDNLDTVTIGNNVCISQGALLLCGNHHYKKPAFDLITGKITLEDGAWVGAKTVVCPGVTIKQETVLTVGSIATSSLESFSIYQGNPAKKIKDRVIRNV